MEDNLTKAKRALMIPKQLCPTGANVHALESKANPGEQDEDKLTKLREVLIKKSREYCTTFIPQSQRKDKHGVQRSVIMQKIIESIQLQRKTRNSQFTEQ